MDTIESVLADLDAYEDVHQRVQRLCQWLTIEDRAYVARLKQRIAEGTAPGEVEALVLRLALGG